MELYLDTADVTAVKRLARIYPLAGVTTNPSIVAGSGKCLEILLPELRDVLGAEGKIFAQVIAKQAAEMVKEARYLNTLIDNLVVKIPVTAEGLVAIKALKEENIPTLGTAVYSAGQGLLAALAGAQYIAPYVNRLDAQSGNGTETVADLNKLLQLHAPGAKVLAASFKNTRQVVDCLLAGSQSVTIPVDVADQFITSAAVDAAIVKFDQDWENAFGDGDFVRNSK